MNEFIRWLSEKKRVIFIINGFVHYEWIWLDNERNIYLEPIE